MRFLVVDADNLVQRLRFGGKAKLRNDCLNRGPFEETSPTHMMDLLCSQIINDVFVDLWYAYTRFDIDHIVIAFDRQSWRRWVYEDYKADRRAKIKTPEEEAESMAVRKIIDELHEYFLHYTNATTLACEGVEADDLVARWCQMHSDPEQFENIVMSADSDLRQLVNTNTSVYDAMGKTIHFYTPHGIYYQNRSMVARKRKGMTPVKLYNENWYPKLDKDGNHEMFDQDWFLFEKCIRGDKQSDSITSAWPGVRTKKMQKAYYGSVEEWNNFINSYWGPDDDRQSVRELYERNRMLIDLTKQPDEIKELMDSHILQALERDQAKFVRLYFSKFCAKFKLPYLVENSERYFYILSQRY